MHNVYTYCWIISMCKTYKCVYREGESGFSKFDFSRPLKIILKTQTYSQRCGFNVAYIKYGIDIAQTDATFSPFSLTLPYC